MYDEIKEKEETVKAIIIKNLIVKYKWLCGFACLVIGLIACHPRTERPTLERAEAWMDTYPDSAQLLLEAIPEPERLSQEEYATWCLLVTQARDKNYVVHTSDSVIDVAVRYFAERNEPHRKAQAYYCQGRVLSDLDISGEALTAYLNAEEAVKGTSDRDLEARICNHLGALYWRNQHTGESLLWYKKAYFAYKQEEDTLGIVNALQNIGNSFLGLGQIDSALFYVNQAYRLAEEGQVDSQKAYILSSLANCYSERGAYQEALKLNLQSLANGEVSFNRYYAIAELYDRLGQSDSVLSYAGKALLSDDLYVRCSSCRLLYKVYAQEQNYPEALRYNEQYVSLRDSIEQVYSAEMLNQVKSRYEKERMVNRHQRQMEQATLQMYGWALWGLAATVVALFIYLISHRLLLRQRVRNREISRVLEETHAQLLRNRVEMETKDNRLAQIQVQLSTIRQEAEQLQQEKGDIQDELDRMEAEKNRLCDEKELLLVEKQSLIRQNEQLVEQQREQLGVVETSKRYQQQIEMLKSELEVQAKEKAVFFGQLEQMQADKQEERKLRDSLEKSCTKWLKALVESDEYLCKCSYLNVWSAAEKEQFLQHFDKILPQFRKRLLLLARLTDREVLVVCLTKLGVKTRDVSQVLGLGPDMTTKIKKDIRDRCFSKLGTDSLDKKLKFWY